MSLLRPFTRSTARTRAAQVRKARDSYRQNKRRQFQLETLEARRVLATGYVGEPSDFVITNDVAPLLVLSAGDTVTWNPGGAQHPAGEVQNLHFGSDAFTSIQSAIAAAGANDTIDVTSGVYNERLEVNKADLKIVGNGSANTIVDYTGQSAGQAGVYITGNRAELHNLGVTHSSPNNASVPRYGIKADYAYGSSTTPVDGVVIDGVAVSNSYRTGLDLNGVTNITVNNFSAINNGGAGIFMTDVKGADLSNITTSGNPWAGVSIATFGQYFPLGTSDIVFSGTNSFGESAAANSSGKLNGGLQFEFANYANPSAPQPISWSNQASDDADVTIQSADFGYMVSGHSFDNGNVYRRFYQTLAEAQSAALGTPDHIEGGSRYIQEADDSNDFGPRTTDFYVYASPEMNIQAAIDAAVGGDVINIAAGTFNENVSVNKGLSLVGDGNGSGPGDTVVSAPGTVVTVSANNVSLNDLRVTGGLRGVLVNGVSNTTLNEVAAVGNSNGVEVGGTTATNLQILNSTLAAGTNGFRMGTGANLDGLTIDGSTVTQNAFGIGVYSAAGSYLKNVVISDSTFADNAQKGMYFEKLTDAVIDGVVVEDSGVDPAYPFNNGIDVNLKYGSYSNITIQNSTFSGSGVRTVYSSGLDYAAALAIKARDDGSYNSPAATLSNVLVKDNVFQDSSLHAMTTAVRIGEPAKNNAGPTSVKICHNDLTDGTFVGVDNTSLAAVDAEFNWWGTTNGATIDSLLALGNVDFTPWLLDSVASGNNLVFTGPDDVSLVVNQATGAYVFVDSNGAIYSGSDASVKNGKLKIHDQSGNGKIDVKGSTDGSVSVSLKGKGKPTNFTLDPLTAAC